MKKIFLAAFIGLALAGCADNKKQEKSALDKVLKIHDKVMDEDEQLMKNKMRLDTLVKQVLPNVKDTVAEKAKIKTLITNLVSANEAMEDWMHKFDADNTGKSHEDIMKYMNDQKVRLSKIDSGMRAAIDSSGNYLIQLKK